MPNVGGICSKLWKAKELARLQQNQLHPSLVATPLVETSMLGRPGARGTGSVTHIHIVRGPETTPIK